MEILNDAVKYFTELLKHGGYISGFLLIILESIIPALPLGVFIALNINAFGLLIGIIISWIATCIGSYMSYLLFNYLSNRFEIKFLQKKSIKKIILKMKTIEFSNLVVIISLPFTPAFAINIASGIVGMSKKKFLLSLLIGKLFIVIFWGCIGKSLLESVTDIKTICIISIFVLVAYFISKLISKKMKIE